jgi:multisubunit Na+/H+ antiporter MnhC subunit
MEKQGVSLAAFWPWMLASALFDLLSVYCLVVWNHEYHLIVALGVFLVGCALLAVAVTRIKGPTPEIDPESIA